MTSADSQNTYNLRFIHPASHLIVGPPGCGKSVKVSKLIREKNTAIENGDKIKPVIWFYDHWQPLFDELKEDGIVNTFLQVAPTKSEFEKVTESGLVSGTGSIVVIDDFESEIGKDLDQIVRVLARHRKCTVLLLFQNLFPVHKFSRSISLQVKYIHLFPNPRDNYQIVNFVRQLLPHDYKWLVEAFNYAVSVPFTSFLFDLTQSRESFLRYRSHVLPSEGPMRVYFKRGSLSGI